MKRVVVIAAALAALTLSTVAQAQTQTPPAAPPPSTQQAVSPEKLALAREVFQITNLKQLMDGMDAMMSGMSQTLAGKLPDPQQQKIVEFRKAMYEEMQATFVPRLIDQMSYAYAQTFTADELRGIIAFYKSPPGEALVQKTPALFQNLMPAMVKDVPDLMRGAITRYCSENHCTPEERAAFAKTLAAMPGSKG